jgi:hypothetical protein
VFRQDVEAGNAERRVSILHQQRDVCGALEDYFHSWQAAHGCKVLARVIAIDFHAALGEKGERRRFQRAFAGQGQP